MSEKRWWQYPRDEWEYHRARELEAEKKEADPNAEKGESKPIRGAMTVMTDMNAPSAISRTMHAGMASKCGAQRSNFVEKPSPLPNMEIVPSPEHRPKPAEIGIRLGLENKVAKLERLTKTLLGEVEGLRVENAELKRTKGVSKKILNLASAHERALQKNRERVKRYWERQGGEN